MLCALRSSTNVCRSSSLFISTCTRSRLTLQHTTDMKTAQLRAIGLLSMLLVVCFASSTQGLSLHVVVVYSYAVLELILLMLAHTKITEFEVGIVTDPGEKLDDLSLKEDTHR